MAIRLSGSYNIGGVIPRVEYRLYTGELSGGEKYIGRIWDLEGVNGGVRRTHQLMKAG